MSKKNSSVILKNSFKEQEELSTIYSSFKKKISHLKKKIFLVAVSGGPDSLALAALAKSYNYNNKSKFYFVLVDHRIRKNSSAEAISVKKLLKRFKITLHILKNKNSIKKNVQSEARNIRYNLLKKFCKQKKIQTILTAHNLEDQVETFFIRLSRGSGLQGLSSMNQINKIDTNINLVRPLLDFKKSQLIKIASLIFGKFYKDPSNKDKKYLRTRIRGLKKSLENAGINYEQIFKSIKNLASSRDTLNFYFNKIYKNIVLKKRNKFFINLKNFNILNLEMKMRVLKRSIQELSDSYYPLRSRKIVNLIDKIKLTKKMKTTLGRCIISTDKNHLIMKKEIKNKQFT